jgi:hypothetical protein
MATAVISQIQRGTITMTGSYYDTTISAVDLTKTIVRFSSKANGAVSVYDMAIYWQLTSSTDLKFQRAGGTGTITVSYEVISFSSGVTTQIGSNGMGAASEQIAITSTNLTKSWIEISWGRSSNIMDQSCFIRAQFNSATQIQLDSLSAVGTTCNYVVVQYDNCSVQAVAISNGNAQTFTQSITSSSTSKTMLICSGEVHATQTINQTMIYQTYLTNATTVTFTKYGSAGNGFDFNLFAITFTDNNTVDHYTQSFVTGDTSNNLTVTSRALATTMHQQCWGTEWMMGGTNDSTDAGWHAEYCNFESVMTSATNITLSRISTGYTSVITIQVINFPGTAPTNKKRQTLFFLN